MAKETPKITKEKVGNEVITRAKLEPIVKDLKEFIVSTVKGSEAVLGKRFNFLEGKIEATQGYVVKMEKRLDEKIEGVRAELVGLSEKMDRVINKVDAQEEKLDTHLTAHI